MTPNKAPNLDATVYDGIPLLAHVAFLTWSEAINTGRHPLVGSADDPKENVP